MSAGNNKIIMFSGGSHRHPLLGSKLGQGGEQRLTQILLGRTKPGSLEWLSWEVLLSTDLQKVPGLRFADTAPGNSAVPDLRTMSGLVVPENINLCVEHLPDARGSGVEHFPETDWTHHSGALGKPSTVLTSSSLDTELVPDTLSNGPCSQSTLGSDAPMYTLWTPSCLRAGILTHMALITYYRLSSW